MRELKKIWMTNKNRTVQLETKIEEHKNETNKIQNNWKIRKKNNPEKKKYENTNKHKRFIYRTSKENKEFGEKKA